jgi:hypothetical protein
MRIRWDLSLDHANLILQLLATTSGPNVSWKLMNDLIVPLQQQTQEQVKDAEGKPPLEVVKK